MTTTDLSLNIQAVAPDYEIAVLTIQDRYEFESRWIIPCKSDHNRIEQLTLLHIRYSQGLTRRN